MPALARGQNPPLSQEEDDEPESWDVEDEEQPEEPWLPPYEDPVSYRLRSYRVVVGVDEEAEGGGLLPAVGRLSRRLRRMLMPG
ncbi:hypothetical protein [Streptomyces sp. AMCC400023]|uniref:hypothetical protein n=1 Tax=Streptomyces sp. AMCC400023 TaxID=2056258 RepID=UPI001F1AAA73|nr:hypothetical protein [Streptomyces sp. AMCC400023]UJV42992.1 hypothetical protein CVT30_26915 [Streptomyces sp. AMCC400023]